MKKHKILLSVGTRPEIIKIAPLYIALRDMGVQPMLLHTGQHDELAYPLYKFFNITPDIDITIERKRNSSNTNNLLNLNAVLLDEVSPYIIRMNPDIIAVHGDTLSAHTAAWIGFCCKIDIAHIEGGLRSYDKYQPFPEEKNREIIARIADLHFAPTVRAEQNLLKEGIAPSAIHVVGNTVVDAIKIGLNNLVNYQVEHPALRALFEDEQRLAQNKILLVTAHRRENQPENLHSIVKAIGKLLMERPDFLVVWPVHPNTEIIAAIQSEYDELPKHIRQRIILTSPLNYPDLLQLIMRSWILLTDSGGIQEEAASLHKPVLILRENTERPEVIECGAGILVGTSIDKIISAVNKLAEDKEFYDKICLVKNPFGEGNAGEKIARLMIEYLDKKNSG